MNFRILLIIASIVALTACGGAEERKAAYLEKAKSSIEAGDLDKARIELKNVLQIDPKDGEAYYQLGKVYMQQRDYRKAYGNYLKAEELSPSLLANHAQLGRIYLLLMNDTDKTREKIDLILSKEADNSDGLLLKAALMQREGKISEAIEITETIIARDAQHTESVEFLASLYIKEKRINEAIELLDTVIKNNENNEQLNRLLAATLLSNKDYERAEIIYKNFLERNPDTSASYNNLAAFYSQSGNKDKALETLRASVENDPNDVERQLILVKYVIGIKGREEGVKELKSFIAKNSSLGQLRTALGELLYVNGDKQDAIIAFENAIKDFSEEKTGVEARISLATIYINDKEYTAAKKVINEAISISPNDPKANMLKAKLAINDKDLEQAIIALRVVTKETPENIDAFILLAGVYQLEGNEEQIRSTLNSAHDNNKTNAEALLKLARYLLTSDIEQAEKVIDNYNNIKEADYDGLSIKASILNKKKSYSEAYELSDVLMEKYPEKPAGYLQSIPYYSQQGDKQKAISTLEKGYISCKDNRQILVLLSTLQVSEKQFDLVEKRINAELAASPEDAQLNILLSKVYIAGGKNDFAISAMNDFIAKNPDNEEAYLLLSQIYLVNNDSSAYEATLLKGKSNVTDSINIPIKLATYYDGQKEYAKSIDIYRELNNLYPDNLVVVNNLASMLSDHGNDDDLKTAVLLVDKLKESAAPVFMDTIGWVYYKSGDLQPAIEYLTKAVEANPDVNIYNYHLGMAHKMAGDTSQAKVYLEKSLADNKPFVQKGEAEAALKDL